MTSITQDMRYRLFLIRFAEKYGVSKTAINIRPTVSIFIAGSVAMMVRLNPGTALAVRITTPTVFSFGICTILPFWGLSSNRGYKTEEIGFDLKKVGMI